MDPSISVDAFGNGKVTIYRYGKTWVIDVVEWVGKLLPYQPPENPMNRVAQWELNQLRDKAWA